MRAMRFHPQHLLLPWYRYAIYEQLKKLSSANGTKQPEPPLYEGGKRVSSVGYRARGWLAILAAEKVLPIWNSGTPELNYHLGEDTPQELLTVARGVISGEVDGKEGFEQTAGAHE